MSRQVVNNPSNAVFTMGHHSPVHHVVLAPADGAALATLRGQVELLVADLAAQGESSAPVVRAKLRADDMQEAVDASPPDPAHVRGRWDQLRRALAAPGVVGVVGFSADVAQIAGTVASLFGG